MEFRETYPKNATKFLAETLESCSKYERKEGVGVE